MPVLLLDGEELVGAKQNRVLNLTILVAAQSTLTIPVSCVERGRWRRVSRAFQSAPRAHFAEGRAAKMRDVTASLLQTGTRRSDQGDVWSRIAHKSARLGAESDTGAMAAMFDQAQAPIERFVEAFPLDPRQAGGIFLINGRIVGLELFDAPATWRKLAPKLIRSYAVDAIDRRSRLDPRLPTRRSSFSTPLRRAKRLSSRRQASARTCGCRVRPFRRRPGRGRPGSSYQRLRRMTF